MVQKKETSLGRVDAKGEFCNLEKSKKTRCVSGTASFVFKDGLLKLESGLITEYGGQTVAHVHIFTAATLLRKFMEDYIELRMETSDGYSFCVLQPERELINHIILF